MLDYKQDNNYQSAIASLKSHTFGIAGVLSLTGALGLAACVNTPTPQAPTPSFSSTPSGFVESTASYSAPSLAARLFYDPFPESEFPALSDTQNQVWHVQRDGGTEDMNLWNEASPDARQHFISEVPSQIQSYVTIGADPSHPLAVARTCDVYEALNIAPTSNGGVIATATLNDCFNGYQDMMGMFENRTYRVNLNNDSFVEITGGTISATYSAEQVRSGQQLPFPDEGIVLLAGHDMLHPPFRTEVVSALIQTGIIQFDTPDCPTGPFQQRFDAGVYRTLDGARVVDFVNGARYDSQSCNNVCVDGSTARIRPNDGSIVDLFSANPESPTNFQIASSGMADVGSLLAQNGNELYLGTTENGLEIIAYCPAPHRESQERDSPGSPPPDTPEPSGGMGNDGGGGGVGDADGGK